MDRAIPEVFADAAVDQAGPNDRVGQGGERRADYFRLREQRGGQSEGIDELKLGGESERLAWSNEAGSGKQRDETVASSAGFQSWKNYSTGRQSIEGSA